MIVVHARDELRDALADRPRPFGLVPTMGWLHAGHRSLFRRARAENGTTIATIFVNPRQFNEAADYQRYPRNEARDLAICAEESVDIVFVPPVEAIYPPGFDTTVTLGRGTSTASRRSSRSSSTSSAPTAPTSGRRTPSR